MLVSEVPVVVMQSQAADIAQPMGTLPLAAAGRREAQAPRLGAGT